MFIPLIVPSRRSRRRASTTRSSQMLPSATTDAPVVQADPSAPVFLDRLDRKEAARLQTAIDAVLDPHRARRPMTIDFEGAPMEISVPGYAEDTPEDILTLGHAYDAIIDRGALAGSGPPVGDEG